MSNERIQEAKKKLTLNVTNRVDERLWVANVTHSHNSAPFGEYRFFANGISEADALESLIRASNAIETRTRLTYVEGDDDVLNTVEKRLNDEEDNDPFAVYVIGSNPLKCVIFDPEMWEQSDLENWLAAVEMALDEYEKVKSREAHTINVDLS